ncbi:phage tail termination protein [Rhodococcoides fascians]|uniref:phage tail termination protein n=1 Tax=Rhodococcoides fascians TaxID=1828 RepID=UPI00050C4E6B|nr:hypothetical protein [Rhodococcus fascians]
MDYPEYGEYPDFEQVLVDLLTPIAYTCTTIPDSPEELEEAMPLIWARRTGGAPDVDDITDNAMVQLTIFSHTRSQSQRIAGKAKRATRDAGGTRVNGVLIDHTHEMSGVLEIPDLDPLNRTVQVGFVISARRQY